MGAEPRLQLIQALATALGAPTMPPSVAERVAVAAATLALRAESEDASGASGALEGATRLALDACQRDAARGLAFLRALADEVPAADLGPPARRELEARAKRVARDVALPALAAAATGAPATPALGKTVADPGGNHKGVAAAAATWRVRGDESRPRRGRDVESPAETSRGAAAAAT